MSHEAAVVRMADDIARNLAHLPPAQSAEAIAAHLRSFWDPRMREQLRQVAAADPAGIDPVVAQAISLLSAGG